MIRRWSRINTVNLIIDESGVLKKNLQLAFLKNSIHHKKFINTCSKFNRRIISKWKRRSNWLLYINILNHWSSDYTFYKKFIKFQFMFNSFKNTTLFYSFTYIKKKKTPVFRNLQNFIFVFVSKNTFKYFNKNFFSLANCALLFNFSNKFSLSNSDENFLNLYSNRENSLFSVKQSHIASFNVLNLLNFALNQIALKTTEIYKILIILFYIKILKL